MTALKRIILYGFVALLVTGVGMALIGRDRAGEGPELPVEPVTQNHDLTLNQIHHVATQDGVTEWTLDAESAQYQRNDQKTLFKEVAATFFLKDGQKIHLKGKDGVLMTDTKDMEVSGSVVLETGPYKLDAEKLIYSHGNTTVSTETPVTITGKFMSLGGDRMVFNLETETLVLTGRVEAVIEEGAL